MMGRTHSLSGAAGWLAGCAGLTAAGHPQPATVVTVGAVVSAGMALLPDIDHPGSTIARTLGPLTRLIAYGVAAGADWLRGASCDHCGGHDRGGHRALTHTGVFAIALGGLCALAAWAFPAAGLVVVWVAAGLSARALLSRRQRGTLGAAGLATAVTLLVWAVGTPGWWVGVPVAWGTLAHSLGDAATKSGAPLVWPLRLRGCRWHALGTPRWARFRTGGGVERFLFVVLLVGSVFGLGFVLAVG